MEKMSRIIILSLLFLTGCATTPPEHRLVTMWRDIDALAAHYRDMEVDEQEVNRAVERAMADARGNINGG